MASLTALVEKPGYHGLTLEATTGSYRSATTRHYKDETGRGIEVIRTHKARRHGVIVTVKAVYGGDYRTPSETRYATLLKGVEGWFVVEEGWGHRVGLGDDSVWYKRTSETARTKADAEGLFLTAVREGVALPNDVDPS